MSSKTRKMEEENDRSAVMRNLWNTILTLETIDEFHRFSIPHTRGYSRMFKITEKRQQELDILYNCLVYPFIDEWLGYHGCSIKDEEEIINKIQKATKMQRETCCIVLEYIID